jgi:hypothetical protein
MASLIGKPKLVEGETANSKDDFGRHEVLHMSSFLMGTVWEHLVEHPAVAERPDWLALSKKAHQALFDLYQAIGAEHLQNR